MKRALVLAALVSLAPAAQAFVRTSDPDTGVCLAWASRTVGWQLNQKGSDDAPFPSVQAAVERSFAAWQDVTCSDIAFTFQGVTPRFDTGFDPGSNSNINLLVWREQRCDQVVPPNDACQSDGSCPERFDCWDHGDGVIALTTTSYDRDTGEIADADIEFNGAPDHSGRELVFTTTVVTTPRCSSGVTVDCVATDVQNTATHEIGHFIGLAHSPDPEATMFGSAAFGETKKRSLAPDDVNAVCDVYPTGRPTPSCAAGPGQVGFGPGSSSGDDGGCGCGEADAGIGALAALLLRRLRRRPDSLSSGPLSR